MNKFSTVALLVATVAVGTPAAAQINITSGGAFVGPVAPTNGGGAQFWDNLSSDNPTGACNVGFVLTGAGQAPDCAGTPNLLGVGGQYFNSTATTFNFGTGQYEFEVYNNIAGFTAPGQQLFATNGGASMDLLAGGIPSGPMIVDFGSSFRLQANSFNPAGQVRSDALFNGEGFSRWALFQTADQGTTFIGFEDNTTGDFDYNDLVISVRYLGGSQVPEPASMALVGLGLFGLAVVSRRRSTNS